MRAPAGPANTRGRGKVELQPSWKGASLADYTTANFDNGPLALVGYGNANSQEPQTAILNTWLREPPTESRTSTACGFLTASVRVAGDMARLIAFFACRAKLAAAA